MKKIIIVVATIVVCIATIILLIANLSGQQFNADNANREVQISWSEVNLRDTHSTKGDVVDTLYQNETVILTGYSYEYLGGNGESTESWVEIITQDEKHGWIVTESIDW